MGSKVEFTELEKRVLDSWNELVFEGGGFSGKPLSREELDARELAHRPRWDALLKLAYDGQSWLVCSLVASTISNGRWHNAMILREYDRAEEEALRFLKHREMPEKINELNARIHTLCARLAKGEFEQASKMLEQLLSSGDNRTMLTGAISYSLLPILADFESNGPPHEAVKALVKLLVRSKKQNKKLQDSCMDAQTWSELEQCLRKALFLGLNVDFSVNF